MSSRSKAKRKIYCAGPLFNEAEKAEMGAISKTLEDASYSTFLPQRDGLELATAATFMVSCRGLDLRTVNAVLSRAIFSLDVYQVAESEGLVLNMNGRVPDEGAMVEAGIAWAQNKEIVIFKNDARTLMNGADNPLVLGLSNFVTACSHEDIVAQFNTLFSRVHENPLETGFTTPTFQVMKEKGREIWAHLQSGAELEGLCDLLFTLFGGDCGTDEHASRARCAV